MSTLVECHCKVGCFAVVVVSSFVRSNNSLLILSLIAINGYKSKSKANSFTSQGITDCDGDQLVKSHESKMCDHQQSSEREFHSH